MTPLLLGFRDWRSSCYTSTPLPNLRADPKQLDSCTMRPLHPPLGLQIAAALVSSLQPSLRPTSPPKEKCLPPVRWPSSQRPLLTIRDKMGVCLCSHKGHARGQGCPAHWGHSQVMNTVPRTPRSGGRTSSHHPPQLLTKHVSRLDLTGLVTVLGAWW